MIEIHQSPCLGVRRLVSGVRHVITLLRQIIKIRILPFAPIQALKNFFYYVDELDRIVEARGQETLSKSEFKEVLCRLTGTHVTDEETDFIFKMFDADKDGKLVKSEVKLGQNIKNR